MRSSGQGPPDTPPPFIDRNPPPTDEPHRETSAPVPLPRAEPVARTVADETVEFGVEPDDTGGGFLQFYWKLPDVTAWLGVFGVIVFSIGFYLYRRPVQAHR